MSAMATAAELEQAFLDACRAELRAIKVGNVHVHAAGHGMQVAQFEAAAVAAAPHVANPALGVGERILRGVEASFAAAGCNTNLGILLLCVPLARAAELSAPTTDLRTRLATVLATLDAADAANVFRAIARANPGGLGKADTADVSAPPTISLLQAMALAKHRDRIANAYVTSFSDIFDVALPQLAAAHQREKTADDAVAALHMAVLATFPDSHIERKYGSARAETVRAAAAALLPDVTPLTQTAAQQRLLAFDAELKAQGLNPGTTADFVVASLFAAALISRGRHTAAV